MEFGWTPSEFGAFCERKGIPKSAYSLFAERDESYCVEKTGPAEWLIYYSERGRKNELAWAKNEHQALNVLSLFLLEAFKKI
jgi:hypothetical protein